MLLKLLVPHLVLWGYIINVLCFRTVLHPYLKSHFYMSIQPAFQAYLKKHHKYISISGPQFGNWYIRFKFFVHTVQIICRLYLLEKAQGFTMHKSAYFQWWSRLPKCISFHGEKMLRHTSLLVFLMPCLVCN